MNYQYIDKNESINAISNDVILRNSVVLDNVSNLDFLLQKIGDANYVLLGEASHGTHEYYSLRTEISKKTYQRKRIFIYCCTGRLARLLLS